ncbi:MAG: hypothetical protein U0X86_000449 [Wolbachia endosymbiont of Xenopsylla cheopis]
MTSKANLTETKPVLYKKLRSIIVPYLNNKNEFDKESQKKLLNSIKNLQKETDQYSSVVHFDNPKKCNKKLIDSLINYNQLKQVV